MSQMNELVEGLFLSFSLEAEIRKYECKLSLHSLLRNRCMYAGPVSRGLSVYRSGGRRQCVLPCERVILSAVMFFAMGFSSEL